MKEIKGVIEVSGRCYTNTKNVTGFITDSADIDIYTNCSTVRIQDRWHGYLMPIQ